MTARHVDGGVKSVVSGPTLTVAIVTSTRFLGLFNKPAEDNVAGLLKRFSLTAPRP